MVKFNDLQDEYDSKTFKSYKRYKQYVDKIQENDSPDKPLIENKYFNCLYCGKVNRIEDIISEKSHNMTMRARYITWKKLKDISNELGGSLENGLNYLLSLHEGLVPAPNQVSDERTIGIAGFGGEDKKGEEKEMKNCDICRQTIEDDTLCVCLEIGKMGWMANAVYRWYHFECYDKARYLK